MLQKNRKNKVLLLKKHSHSTCVSYCTWPEPQKIWVNFSQKKQSCLCGFWEYHLLQFPLLPLQRSGALSANKGGIFPVCALAAKRALWSVWKQTGKKRATAKSSACTALLPASRMDLEYLGSLSSAEKILQGVTTEDPSACREGLGHNRKF